MKATCGLGLLVLLPLSCDRLSERASEEPRRASAVNALVESPKTTPSGQASEPARVRPVLPGQIPPGLFESGSCATESAKACELACKKGDPLACDVWAVRLENGWGVPRDLARARQVAEPGCEKGRAMACGILGAFYAAEGTGPDDGQEGVRLLFSACQKGDALSCERLAKQRANKKSPGYAPQQALDDYFKACDGGHLRACAAAATLVEDEDLSTDRDVEELWKRTCEAGFAIACSRWARATRQGRYGKADLKLASQRYDEACRLGHVMSCE